MRSTYITKKRRRLCKLNGSGVVNLIGTTSSTSFTWPITFGKRHHSPPHNILCASPQWLHPNVTFPQDSQVRVSKLGLFLSQNFGCSYFSWVKCLMKTWGQYLVVFKKIFPRVYNTPQLNFIWFLLSKDLWSEVNPQFDSRPFLLS
jgi:hypothetical protein